MPSASLAAGQATRSARSKASINATHGVQVRARIATGSVSAGVRRAKSYVTHASSANSRRRQAAPRALRVLWAARGQARAAVAERGPAEHNRHGDGEDRGAKEDDGARALDHHHVDDLVEAKRVEVLGARRLERCRMICDVRRGTLRRAAL